MSSDGQATRTRAWSGTVVRLIVAPLVLVGMLAVAWTWVATDRSVGVDLLLALLGGVGGLELARLLLPGRVGYEHVVGALASGLLCAVGLLAPDDAALRHLARVVVVIVALLALLARRWSDVRTEALDRIARGLLPVVYVGVLFSALREVGAGTGGARRLIWVVIVSKASDIGGWIVGKPFGRHKLVPAVSPGKSWEGLAGGLVASALASVLLAGPLDVPEAAWSTAHLVAFGLALGLASVFAGVTQSGFKRRARAKDSSRLIPEMGGVLDMIDSLLLAGPLAWLWLEWVARR